jgi:hypothetical protein
MDLATVPAAPPTRKNQRTTSWPAPISAIVPYQRGSRLMQREQPRSQMSAREVIARGPAHVSVWLSR